MTQAEIVRRLRALIAMAPEDRPVTVARMCKLAGLGVGELYRIGKDGNMLERTRIRLARAFEWVENDQLVVRKRAYRPSEVTIRAPRPPQENRMGVEVGVDGPRVRLRAVNPRAFPES